MKKLVLLVISLALLTPLLSGCIMIPQYKNFEIDTNTVESIEIYDLLKGAETIEVEGATEPFLVPFHPMETTPVYTIPAETQADFLSDLAKIRFTDYYVIITIVAIDPSLEYDQFTARINYTDGSYEFLSCYGYGETYDKSGNRISYHHYSCEDTEWWALIEKYIPADIFSQTYEAE